METAELELQIQQLRGDLDSIYSLLRSTQNAVAEGGVYQEIHGPTLRSVDATHSFTLKVDFDASVTQLYRSKLSIKLFPVRANLSTAASGGGQTTTSAGSQTPTSGASSASSSSTDAPTSASSGSHHHTIGQYYADGGAATLGPSTNTSGAGSNHNHTSATTDSTTSAEPDTGHTHVVSGNVSIESAHTHNMASHTHDFDTSVSLKYFQVGGAAIIGVISASTSDFTTFSAATDHTHTVSHSHTIAHTHTVSIAAHDHTVSNHTHSLTFTAIQEGSAPVTPAMTVVINSVDVTAALGGPWNTDQTLDITTYLRDGASLPLRQTNTITVTSAELLDMELAVKSIVASADPLQLDLGFV